MAKYRAVWTKIWKDPDFQEYSHDAKLLFLYLITNDSVTESGIYPLTVKTAGHETGLSVTTVAKLLDNGLQNVGYDIDNRLVFVVNFKRYNRGGKPELVERSVASDFERTHRSFLWSDFVKEYPQFLNCLETVGKPFANRCGENRTNLNLNLNLNPILTSDDDEAVTEVAVVSYKDFYALYPRHESKAAGEVAWKKIKDKDKPMIMAALGRQVKAHHLNLINRKLCPLPATWLNGKRWEDEIVSKLAEEDAQANYKGCSSCGQRIAMADTQCKHCGAKQ